MVELKCRAELAVTGRSACRNEACENSKERGGRIPQGKLRWGIGGPGGHSMKWYCIRPRCLPADQVKDMLVPEKSGSAPEMDGVSELPDGFREATITCLEYINEDKADQLDAAVLAKLDEVGPMIPIPPRAAVRGDPVPAAPTIGRQGLRRARRSMGAAGGGGASSGGGGSGGGGAGGVNDDDDDSGDSGDNQPGALTRGGSMGGGSSSFTSLPARTPPALLIPRRTTDSGHGGDSPILPPPDKVPKLDDDAIAGESAAASGGAAGAAGASSPSTAEELLSYPGGSSSSPLGGASGVPHVHEMEESVLGSMGDAAAAAGGGHGAAGSPLLFEGFGSFDQKGSADDLTVESPHTASGFGGGSGLGGIGGGAAAGGPAGGSVGSPQLPLSTSSLGTAPGERSVASTAASTEAVAGSLLGGDGTEADDPVASALEGIGDDLIGAGDDPYGAVSGGLLSGGAERLTPAPAPAAAQAASPPHAAPPGGGAMGAAARAEHAPLGAPATAIASAGAPPPSPSALSMAVAAPTLAAAPPLAAAGVGGAAAAPTAEQLAGSGGQGTVVGASQAAPAVGGVGEGLSSAPGPPAEDFAPATAAEGHTVVSPAAGAAPAAVGTTAEESSASPLPKEGSSSGGGSAP